MRRTLTELQINLVPCLPQDRAAGFADALDDHVRAA
jgi:hypothetical protein